MISQQDTDAIRTKYNILQVEFDERARRMWAAAEAKALGHGGVTAVSKATGLAESTIRIGRKEILSPSLPKKKEDLTRRVRQKGGGRKSLEHKNSDLLESLASLVDPESRGDPMSLFAGPARALGSLLKN